MSRKALLQKSKRDRLVNRMKKGSELPRITNNNEKIKFQNCKCDKKTF